MNTRVTRESTAPKTTGAIIAAAYLAPNEPSVHSEAKTFTSRENRAKPLRARCAAGGHENGAVARTETICRAWITIEIDAGIIRFRSKGPRATVFRGASPCVRSDRGVREAYTKSASEATAAATMKITKNANAPAAAAGQEWHSPRAFAKCAGIQSLQR
eukprot:Amastigsp_a676921_6.p2 type:complete len:159 gc:universal Amastigsp_a676921_6:1079-1555(+)